MQTTINILVFGRLAEICGSESIETPSFKHLRELDDYLQKQFPDLVHIAFRKAVNHQLITDENLILQPGDTIALLPPFSGG